MSFLRDIYSADAESKVWDWLRVHGSIVVIVGLCGVIACAVLGKPLDWLLVYCSGFGALLITVAGAMAIRKDNEDNVNEKKED